MISNLEKIKKSTVIVADTGDIELINQIKPQDATTNPSLILKSINQKYKSVNEAIVDIGCKIYDIVPGYISTEVDANYSFDTNETIREALDIISLYKRAGIDTSRILIKIPATWQGIQAARILENELGIKCNLTLIFSLTQAIACAEANVTLISPFVGRVTDYYKANDILYNEDPGVLLVKSIYKYFKQHNYKTIIEASFRNIEQICRLNGCDRLTISPQLISELDKTCDDIHSNLTDAIEADTKKKSDISMRTHFILNWLKM